MAVIHRPHAFPVQAPAPRAPRRRLPLSFTSTVVVLAAIVILALMLMPSIGERPDDHLRARAQGDCISIGAAILRFQADNGTTPKWNAAADARTPGAVGVTVLFGPGRLPREEATGGGWTHVPSAEMNRQLAFNNPDYPLMPSGGTLGWNGPYLSPSDLSPDPWNHSYLVNIGFLEAPQLRGGAGVRAVWVLSAGPNGLVETPLIQGAQDARPRGDDITYRLQ
jgi:hypothetical protein